MKRLIMILLVVCMILPLGACFDEGEPTTPAPPDEVPAVDLGGYEYRAYVYHTGGSGFSLSCETFEGYEHSSDMIGMATYQRNRELELKYNCRIVQQHSKMFNPIEEFPQLQDGGTRFECAILTMFDSVSLAALGYLRDLKTTDVHLLKKL